MNTDPSWISLLPALVAVVTAIITRRSIESLLAGVFAALLLLEPSAALREVAGPEGEVIRPGEWAKAKKSNQHIERLEFNRLSEGKCVQMLHLGSYDEEPASFELMEKYCAENR